jgi:hypothetical protein
MTCGTLSNANGVNCMNLVFQGIMKSAAEVGMRASKRGSVATQMQLFNKELVDD